MSKSLKGGNLILEDVSINKETVDPGEQLIITATVTNGAGYILPTDIDACRNGANPCEGGGILDNLGYCFNLRAHGNDIDAETGNTCINFSQIGSNSRTFNFAFDAPQADIEGSVGVFLELPGSGVESDAEFVYYNVREQQTNSPPAISISDATITNGNVEPVYSSNDPDGRIATAEWRLYKDGQQIDEVEGTIPTLELSGSGQYRIEGTVEDDDGAISTDGFYFFHQVDDPPENSDPTIQITGVSGGPGNISPVYNASDPDGDQLNFDWSVSIDNQVVGSSSNPNPTFNITEPGQYFIDVVVDDGKGGQDNSHHWFTISDDGVDEGDGDDEQQNRAPSITVGEPTINGTYVSPTATVSDPDGDSVSVNWEVTSGGETVTTASGRNPTFNIIEPGQYIIVANAVDEHGLESTDFVEVQFKPDDGDGDDTPDEGQPDQGSGIGPLAIAGGIATLGIGAVITGQDEKIAEKIKDETSR